MERAAKGKILHLFWLLVAVFQLLFAAQLAPAKSAFVPKNRAWEFFPLAAQSHQLGQLQVADRQRERAPPAAKIALGELLGPESETLGNNGSLLSGANNTPTITAAPYGDLSGTLPEGIQANHLSQDAAFRDVIPSDDGLSISRWQYWLGASSTGPGGSSNRAGTPSFRRTTGTTIRRNCWLGAASSFSIDSGSNRGGTIAAGSTDPSSGAVRLGDLVIDSARAFDNSGGTLSATRHVILQSASFDNAGGKIIAATGDLTWIVNGALNNTGASVQVGHNLEISTQGDLNNSGGTINVTGDSQYAVQGTLTNQGGSIATGNNLSLNAVSLNNRQGRVTAGTDIAQFNIQQDADNTGGTISAGGLFQGQIGRTFNQGGTLAGNGQVQLEVQNLENSGSIASAGAVQILAGNLGNQGTIQGDLGVTLQSTTASFSTGSTIESYYGPVQIAVDSALTNQGALTTNQDIVLQIGRAFTNQGNIVAGNNIEIVAAGQIQNSQLVSAGRDL